MESIFPQAVESIVDIHSISTGICVQIVGKRPSRAAEDTEVSAMDHIELWDKAKALTVSYTHLDVYKRQQRPHRVGTEALRRQP